MKAHKHIRKTEQPNSDTKFQLDVCEPDTVSAGRQLIDRGGLMVDISISLLRLKGNIKTCSGTLAIIIFVIIFYLLLWDGCVNV